MNSSHQPDQDAQSLIQPGLEHLHWWGIHSFSGERRDGRPSMTSFLVQEYFSFLKKNPVYCLKDVLILETEVIYA